MTQCFKDHPSDAQRLNYNTKPIAECETRVIELTLTSQCQRVDDGRTISFDNTDLEQSIKHIAAGAAL